MIKCITFLMLQNKVYIIAMLSATGIACKPSPDKQVRETVDHFFSAYRKQHFAEIDSNLLSPSLHHLIDKITEKEKQSAADIAAGDHPTDKPFLVEGDIFTSVYEGADHFRITRIDHGNDTAKVIIYLTNNPNQLNWSDTFVFIQQNNNWELDNVLYGPQNNSGIADLKTVLHKALEESFQ